MLEIPFYVWDFAERFKEDVIDDFVSSYARGETPNPCVRCNERIKFSALSARALALGFDAVATGHYARLSDGRLRRAVDADKDQSYVLGVLTAEQLRHALFPIGDTPKPQIREEAAERGLAVAEKPDSHDICFIPSGDTRRSSAAASGCGAAPSSTPAGPCSPSTTACTVSPSASARDSASPAPAPTARPRYVTAIDADTATVHVGEAADLEVWTLTGEQPVFTSGTAPRGPVECAVQVRAHGGIADAVAAGPRRCNWSPTCAQPLRGVAPGQTMVLYRPDADGDEVIGSATIARAE